MKQVAEIVLRDMDNKDSLYPYHFREEYAEKHVGFIERFCRLPSGKLGHAFNLELFQLAILSVIFGFVDAEGLRQYREVLWIMGRKNGKTALASAIELDLLVNDDEGAPEIYNVATAHDQAAKGFNNALRMVKTSPALAKHVRKRVTDLYCDLNMGVIRALAANTNYLDGLDVSGAIIDELGAMRNRDLYDLTIQGTSARRQPLVLEITTNGFVRAGIFDAQYKYAANWLDGKATGVDAEHFIAFVYELDEREEWENEAAWYKANPGLGKIKSLAALKKNVAKAKNDPTFLPTLLVKDFNLIENQSQAWLTWSEIHNAATFDPADGFKYGVLGVDASDTTDLTAACMLMKRPHDENIYAMHMAWIPERALEQAEREGRRGGRDGVPYDAWIANGYLRTCATPIIDKRVVLEWVQEIQDKYDRDNNDYNTVDYRHILVKAEADENGAYTEEALFAARTKAEDIFAQWRQDPTEEHFISLVGDASDDAGSNTNGGLYEQVTKYRMVPGVNAFLFDEGHVAGDAGVVRGKSDTYTGYHVMYYVGDNARNCDLLAENEMREADYNAKTEEITAGYSVVKGSGMRFVSEL